MTGDELRAATGQELARAAEDWMRRSGLETRLDEWQRRALTYVMTPAGEIPQSGPGDRFRVRDASGAVVWESAPIGEIWIDEARWDVCAEPEGPDALVERIDTLLATVDAARCDVDQDFDASGLPKEGM